MRLKTVIKHRLLGSAGMRVRKIRAGLLRGLRFRVDTASKSMRLIGFDEREIAAAIRGFAARSRTAADVGAADGWYTVYFASRPNLESVWCFDGNEAALERLRDNLSLNRWAASVQVNVVSKLVGAVDDDTSCRLDSLLGDAVEPIMLKIDVEGAEVKVLQGAERMLMERECVLVIETHSAALEGQCIEFLRQRGYSCRVIPPAWYRLLLPEHRTLEHNRWLSAERSRRRAEPANHLNARTAQ